MVVTLIASGGVVEQYTSCTRLDGIDHVDGKVRIVLEAFAITLCVFVGIGIHDLTGSNLGHEFAER